MARPAPLLALLGLATALAGCTLFGAGDREPALSVRVLDAETRRPLVGARVSADGLAPLQAGEGGVAEWATPASRRYQIRVEAPGWVGRDTSAVVEGGPARLTVELRPSPDRQATGAEAVDFLRDPVNTAVLQRRGFYGRRETASGAFLSRGEIEDRGLRLLSDALSTVGGVRVTEFGQVLSNRRNACPLLVYLDGVESASAAAQIDAVAIDDVAGVEVYRSSSEAPPEFYRNRPVGDCGSLLIWTALRR